MSRAPNTAFTQLASELKQSPAQHTFILQGTPAERSQAANAIASHLGLKLYHLSDNPDLSDEQEEELLQTIAPQDRKGVILLFDEADSLFGKRTEVKDAHDRYAQLASAFSGILIFGVESGENLPPTTLEHAKLLVAYDYMPRH
jgi:hypothetical protein